MATIEIKSRNVKATDSLGESSPQHTFIIYTDDNGNKQILRGGQVGDAEGKNNNLGIGNVQSGDLLIVRDDYEWDGIDESTKPIDWNDGTQTIHSSTVASGSDIAISQIWQAMINEGQAINDGGYDYELFTQNCNTTMSHIVQAGQEKYDQLLLDASQNQYTLPVDVWNGLNLSHDSNGNNFWTPGLDYEFSHDLFEKLKDLISNPTDSFQEIIDFAKDNSNLEMESGNVSDFVDAIRDSLQDAFQQSLIANGIQDFLDQLNQAENTQPIRRYDPLTLDLNNNGKIDLVSLSNSNTFFDLDNDGLRENVGWVKAEDGILIFDENNNQSVDNIEELFGYQNPDGSHVTGTQELATHDLNNDGKINSSDAIFNQLKVWQDLNQDGISQSNELKTLAQLNINQINLTNITNLNQNVEGNVIISQGTYQTSDNQTHNLFNLDLAIDQTNSASYQYQDNQGNNITYDLNLDTLSLPFSRGYGNATAWHIAMSEDEELLNIMKEITNLDLNDQNSLKNLDQKIEEFIYQWTGTENITGNRGSFDAKKLAVLEAIRGEVYHDLTGSNNVGPLQVNFVQTAWDQFFNSIKNKILIQSLFKDVFAGAHYDFATDSIDFNNLTATQLFDNIEAQYDSLSAINQVYFAYDIYKFANLTIGKINGINDLTTFKNLLEAQIGISPDNFAFGTDGNETIYFNNIENNVIDSKKGDDLLAGGNGDDIYIFNLGDGHDVIDEFNNDYYFIRYGNHTLNLGNDTIVFGEGITKDNISISYEGESLIIHYGQNDQIEIKKYFYFLGGKTNKIENIKFSDGSTIKLSDENFTMTFIGDDNNNNITAHYAGNYNDILEGKKGDDTLIGLKGDDVYIYNKGDGKDVIGDVRVDNAYSTNESYGNDTIKFGTGITKDNIRLYRNSSDLVIAFKNEDGTESSTDQITIKFQFSIDPYKIENLQFSDGSTLSIKDNHDLILNYVGNSTNESINGHEYGDLIHAGAGNDVIQAYTGINEIYGEDGDDEIYVGDQTGSSQNATYNLIDGGNGNDTITIYNITANGTNNINGGAGNDIITDTSLNNSTLSGGTGDDKIIGGKGNDIYLFNLGDGKDVIGEMAVSGVVHSNENYGSDKIKLGAGITQNDVYFSRNGDNLIIKFRSSPNDQIEIYRQFYKAAHTIESVEFADGSTLNITNPETLYLEFSGTDGVDNINTNYSAGYGYTNDLINSKKGDDLLSAGLGNDKYVFNLGDGADTINEYNDDVSYNQYSNARIQNYGNDEIVFGTGITASNLIFIKDGNHLIIKYSATDKVAIKQYFYGTTNIIENIKFADNSTLNISNPSSLTLLLEGNDSANIINGSNNNDFINAKKGDDTIVGGTGNDVYFYNIGDGKDIIGEVTTGNYYTVNEDYGNDTIKFGAGITKDNIRLYRNSSDLIIVFKDQNGNEITTDQITVKYQFVDNYYKIENLQFSDGSTLSIKDNHDLILNYVGNSTNESINGHEYGDLIHAGAGNDVIQAYTGINEIYGEDGDDEIYVGDQTGSSQNATYNLIDGGNGNDTITIYNITANGTNNINGGAGNDIITDTSLNNSTLSGGTGDDKIIGGKGNDIYLFNLGDGKDVIGEMAVSGVVHSNENYGSDKIKLGAGITQNDVYFSRNGDNLIIKFRSSPNDQIEIYRQFYKAAHTIESVEFADGSTLNITNPETLYLEFSGTDGVDNINTNYSAGYGYTNDLINSKKGDDLLSAGLGNDKYVFNLGDGADTINEYNDDVSYNQYSNARIQNYGNDEIVFGTGITASNLIFIKDGNHLIIKYSATDKVAIKQYFYGTTNIIENIKFADNSTLNISNPSSLTLLLEGNDSANIINGSNNNDFINAKKGDDTIVGGTGNDVYFYNIGDGKDIIGEVTTGNYYTVNEDYGNDTIKFGAGITKDNIRLYRNSSDLIIVFKDQNGNEITTDQITVKYQFVDNYYKIENLQFSDGSTLSIKDNHDLILNYVGNSTNESINGHEYGDLIHAGAGNDVIQAYTGINEIYGEDGDDEIYVGDQTGSSQNATYNLIDGGNGNDTITIYNITANGTNNINGGAGNDIITDTSLNNSTLSGGTGDDKIIGGKGNDIYLFNLGDGKDVIGEMAVSGVVHSNENYGSDKIKLGAGITQNDVYFSRNGDNLIIKFRSSPNDQIEIYRQFYKAAHTIESVEFADGSTLNITNPETLYLEFSGTDGVDNINTNYSAGYGYTNDLINSKKGDDLLSAGLGNDKYVFNLGDGADTINEYNDDVSYNQYSNARIQNYGNDEIVFGTGITASNLIFIKDGNHLIIKYSATDKVAIKQYFYGTTNIIENIKFADNSTLNISNPNNLTLTLDGDDSANSLIGSNANDLINAKKGNDSLVGSDGNDTYIYNIGDGADTINEYSVNSILNSTSSYGVDKIKFGEGITRNDIYFTKSGLDLVVNFNNNSNDKITIQYQFYANIHIVESIVFADGDTLSLPNTANPSLSFNRNPQATLTSFTANEDSNALIDVLSLASDIDGNAIKISKINGQNVISSTYQDNENNNINLFNTINGVLKIIVTQSGYQTISYTPNSNYFGTDSFAYTISDGNGGAITKTVNLTINSANDLPVVTLSSANLDEDSSLTMDVLATASDIDGDVLTIVSVGNAQYGNVQIVTNELGYQTIKYTPNQNYLGTDSFTYTISDGNGGSVTKTINLTIDPANDAPVINSIIPAQNFKAGNNLNFTLSQNSFTDVDLNDSLTLTAKLANGNPLPSWLTFNTQTKTFSGLAPAGNASVDAIAITATDSSGESARQTFNLNLSSNRINGGNNNDNLNGTINNDLIYGGAGNDTIFGNEGNDDNLQGQDGNDNIHGNQGNDILSGGNGNDLLFGDAGDDKIYGGNGNDQLSGNDGNDVINGDAGDDQIFGGDGNDILNGNDGNDIIEGNLGDDKIYGGNGSDLLSGNEGNDTIGGQAGDDRIFGNDGNDILSGSDGNDIIEGNLGNDKIYGGNNNDILYGNEGNDAINGEAGNDKIYGGLGKDILTGGLGNDYFSFSSLTDSMLAGSSSTIANTSYSAINKIDLDLITDFQKGQDKIDLSEINDSIAGTDHDLNFNSFNIIIKNGHTIIDDKNSDFAIDLKSEIHLTADDFNF